MYNMANTTPNFNNHSNKCNPYQMIAIDLDGTLFNSTGRISTQNIDAIHLAQETGMDIVICTGRCLSETTGKLSLLNLKNAVAILAGGAITIDYDTEKTIQRSTISYQMVVKIVEFLYQKVNHAVLLLKDHSESDIDYLVVGEGEIDAASQWWFDNMPVKMAKISQIHEDPDKDHTVRVSIVTNALNMPQITQSLINEFGNQIFVHHFPAISGSADGSGRLDKSVHLMEIFSQNTNKWSAIINLAKSRNISENNIVTIGDEHNDYAMIKNAGLGIAMGNAIDSLKNIARYTTCTNNEHGVAYAINQILNGDWS